MIRIAATFFCAGAILAGVAVSAPKSHARTVHAHNSVRRTHGAAKGRRHIRRRRIRRVGPRLRSGVALNVYARKTSVVAPGVTYTEEIVSRNHWRVGIVRADLAEDSLRIELCKSAGAATGMERVQDLAHRIDSTTDETVIAAVNANYWRAATHDVLGAAVHDGIVIGFDNIKPWSKFQAFADGTYGIAPDSILVTVQTPHGSAFSVGAVNIRPSDSAIVLYNRYYGPMVPLPDTTKRPAAAEQPLADPPDSTQLYVAQDSTELFYDSDEDAAFITDTMPVPHSEKRTWKCTFRLLDAPHVNEPYRCCIVGDGAGATGIPANGGVLSFPPADSALYCRLHSGDTLILACTTEPATEAPVEEMVMGGPRLVRNGRVSVETAEENFHRRTFIYGSHARTAVGVSKDQHVIYLVAVDRPLGNWRRGRPGIGLRDLARLLVAAGAYNAMNLDGGSSTTLVVNGATAFPDAGYEHSRRVASALCIVRAKRPFPPPAEGE